MGVIRIPETIFYRPRPRDEDALSYAFLAFIERLERKTLRRLFKMSGIRKLKLNPDFETVFQPIFRNGSIKNYRARLKSTDQQITAWYWGIRQRIDSMGY